ncbi:hypothetical protein DFS34DRAFT_219605 [Phlyctochytrium arcticum]|nr:hypothetical protein DFS34DRAFT_219605 [Phlyctochytrium arcticum]
MFRHEPFRLAMILIPWLLCCLPAVLALQSEQIALVDKRPALDASVSLPLEWESLGPFPHGSRELGVDILSAYGGFENLNYSEDARFPSELVDGGFVGWQKVRTSEDQSVRISYPEVRWDFNQKPFGWSALQHASYFRGQFEVPESGPYLVEFSGIVSINIDGTAYPANVYGYEHASHSVVNLEKGKHTLYVFAVMDVRVSGGVIPPELHFSGSLVKASTLSENHGMIHFPEDAVLPEIIGSDLITSFASLTFINANQRASSNHTASHNIDTDKIGQVQVLSARASITGNIDVNVTLPIHFSLILAPGQIAPVPLNISTGLIPNELEHVKLNVELICVKLETRETFSIEIPDLLLVRRKWSDVYKITFLDYDFSVHYTMARPPKNSCSAGDHKCPVILALHGAGVDASSPFWTDAYRQQDRAWILYPTGRTTWGFDWHGPSFRNVEFALDALHLLPGVPVEKLNDLSVSRNKLIYAGHSNGGQGAWWLASHYPDKALAALPASGYMKIQFYAPYYMRVGDTYADPVLRALMDVSIAEHDIDLYAPNMGGIPILSRHGAFDDNVPPLHSRRLVRLVNEWNRNAFSTNLSEIPAQGHWFDGVVNDEVLQQFLDKHVDKGLSSAHYMPDLPDAFTITSINPASTGSKGGIRILQLEVPFRLGTIRVHRLGDKWQLTTSNIRRFGFVPDARQKEVKSWSVDGTEFDKAPIVSGPSYARLDPDASWKEEGDLLWISKERHPSTYGPIASVRKTGEGVALETNPETQIMNHPFIIVVPSQARENQEIYEQLALTLATSWYIYARGITQIIKDVDVLDGIAARYNLIVLGGPSDNAYTKRRANEGTANMVKFLDNGGFKIDKRSYVGPGTGIIFLAPSPIRTRTAVFIAGTDVNGLLRAGWSLPFRTGLQAPDYLVVGDEYGDPQTGWTAADGAPFGGAGTKGVGGILAAGYWNNTWDWDSRCGYLK